MQDGEDRPDDAFGGHVGRFLGGPGDAGAGAGPPLVDHVLQLCEDLRAALEHAGARPQGLHHADPCQAGLLVHEAQHREQARADALPPARLPLVGLADERAELVHGLVEDGEEAVLAVLEEVVEGLTGDPRSGDHLGDGQARVADFLHRLRSRREHAAALNLRNLPTWQSIGARTQPRGHRAGPIL